jgi:hypothetical protein
MNACIDTFVVKTICALYISFKHWIFNKELTQMCAKDGWCVNPNWKVYDYNKIN